MWQYLIIQFFQNWYLIQHFLQYLLITFFPLCPSCPSYHPVHLSLSALGTVWTTSPMASTIHATPIKHPTHVVSQGVFNESVLSDFSLLQKNSARKDFSIKNVSPHTRICVFGYSFNYLKEKCLVSSLYLFPSLWICTYRSKVIILALNWSRIQTIVKKSIHHKH